MLTFLVEVVHHGSELLRLVMVVGIFVADLARVLLLNLHTVLLLLLVLKPAHVFEDHLLVGYVLAALLLDGALGLLV